MRQKTTISERVLVFFVTLALLLLVFGMPSRAEDNAVSQWRDLVSDHFPQGQVDRALAIIQCESHGDPMAHNGRDPGTGSYGLFQINSGWVKGFILESGVRSHNRSLNSNVHGVSSTDDLYDPYLNVASAAYIQSNYGWKQWSCHGKV